MSALPAASSVTVKPVTSVSAVTTQDVFRLASNTPHQETPAKPRSVKPGQATRREKRAKVVFMLDTSPRVERTFGRDVFARILRMRLAGARTCDIARAVGCSRDLIEGQLRLWEQQIDSVCEDMAGKPISGP